jgi:uncharacterized RDD family membrane protein YckC
LDPVIHDHGEKLNRMNDEIRIETPEAVSFGYEVAGIGSRFMAALVDSLLIVIIEAMVLLVVVGVLTATPGDLLSGQLGVWIVAGLGLLAFALLWGYYLFFEMLWNGQSPGKRWVGLRVIKDTGAPVSLVDSAIRNLVRLVDFLPAYYGVGVLVMFLNDQARRLGDFAAGTLVIRERKDVTLESLTASPRPSEPGTPVESLPGLENLTSDDYDLIVRFLQRRHGLANRDQLALRLAATIDARMGLSPRNPSPQAAEQFLEHVVNDYRQRAQAGGEQQP